MYTPNTNKIAEAMQKQSAVKVAHHHKARRDIRIKMQTINILCEVAEIGMSPMKKAQLMGVN